jgi:hypothetical protein
MVADGGWEGLAGIRIAAAWAFRFRRCLLILGFAGASILPRMIGSPSLLAPMMSTFGRSAG